MQTRVKEYLFVTVIFLQTFSLSAQEIEKTVIHAGDTLSSHTTYRFPSFIRGDVKLKDRRSVHYQMNFNTFFCTMQFLDETGDTLDISNTGYIDSIRLDSCSFFYHQGYGEVLAASDTFKLVVLWKVSIEPVKLGAFGNASRTASIETYGTMTGAGGPRQLLANEDLYIKKETSYLLVDPYNVMVSATKSNFLKMFRENKKEIENFLHNNPTNFYKQADLTRLFKFCTGLRK